jgi:hypothetical protein
VLRGERRCEQQGQVQTHFVPFVFSGCCRVTAPFGAAIQTPRALYYADVACPAVSEPQDGGTKDGNENNGTRRNDCPQRPVQGGLRQRRSNRKGGPDLRRRNYLVGLHRVRAVSAIVLLVVTAGMGRAGLSQTDSAA